MTVCNLRSQYVTLGRRHRFLDNVTLSADYNSKKMSFSSIHGACTMLTSTMYSKPLPITFGRLLDNNQFFFTNFNYFTLHVQWISGVGQMHPLTPPSYPLCYTLPSLLLNTTYHSHLYIFIFCSLYKLSKKTCEVHSEVNVF